MLDGVLVLGVDEHVWRHTRRGDKYVTVIIDLTPIREGQPNRAGTGDATSGPVASSPHVRAAAYGLPSGNLASSSLVVPPRERATVAERHMTG